MTDSKYGYFLDYRFKSVFLHNNPVTSFRQTNPMAMEKSRSIPWHILCFLLLLGIWLFGLYGYANSQGLLLSLLALLCLPLNLGLGFLNTKRFRLFAFATFSLFYMGYLPYGLQAQTLVLLKPFGIGLMFLLLGSSYTFFFSYFGNLLQQSHLAKQPTPKQILKDDLTSLPNRKYMQNLLTEAVNQAEQDGLLFSVMVLNIDYLSQLNEQYGRPFGDKLVKRFAEHIRRLLRQSDVIARWDDKDFVVLLYHAEPSIYRIILKRLGNSFDMEGAISQASFSGGISFYKQGDSPKDVLERAQTALLRAKAKGRRCYELGYKADAVSANYQIKMTNF